MRFVNSRFVAIFALFLFAGQVAASPLLLCADMTKPQPISSEPDCHGSDKASTIAISAAESHASHDMVGQVADHGHDAECALCASCSSAADSNSHPAGLPSASNGADRLTSQLVHASPATPFRPPITA